MNLKIRNTKALWHFLAGQMEKLDNDEITDSRAKAQAAVAKQIVQINNYELARVRTQIEISHHNQNQNFQKLELREVESTSFDKTNVA